MNFRKPRTNEEPISIIDPSCDIQISRTFEGITIYTACISSAAAKQLYLYLRPVAGHRTLPHSGIERHRNHREPPGTHLGLRRSDIRRGRSGRWWQDSCHAELCHLAGSEPRGTPQLRRCDHDLYGTDRLQGRMPLRRVRESTSEGRRGRVVERRTSFARAVRIEPQDP